MPKTFVITQFMLMMFCCRMFLGGEGDYEDAINRVNGPPLYRYYDKISTPMNHQRDQIIADDDANDYWGGVYYGNQSPDPASEYELDRKILDIEVERFIKEEDLEEDDKDPLDPEVEAREEWEKKEAWKHRLMGSSDPLDDESKKMDPNEKWKRSVLDSKDPIEEGYEDFF
ncbi:MAG: hypothetical protein Q8Q33_00545 [Chlamydiota bacterium]|nr:hypothetical protein [Chlamydiota bacterium]